MSTVDSVAQLKFFGRLLLPDPADTHLLRTCLLTGAPAAEAFAAWSAGADNLTLKFHAGGSLRRRLLPVLQASLRHSGFTAPAEFRPALRAATLYEDLRTQAYREIAAQTLHALNERGIPFLAVGGVTAGPLLYEDAALRHSHDIDLLLPTDALNHAVAVLEQHRFRHDEALPPRPGDTMLVHESGLPLQLHTRALRASALALGTWDDLRSSAVMRKVFGVECATLGWEHALLRIVLLGPLTASRGSLLWACDAHHLIAKWPIDWSVLTSAIAGPAELLPAMLVLTYLRREIGCDIPAATLAQLEKTWHGLTSSERSAAGQTLILTLIQAGATSPGWIWSRAQTVGERLTVLRSLLFPSAAILVQTESVSSSKDALRYRFSLITQGLARLRKNRPAPASPDHSAGPAAGPGTSRDGIAR